MGPKKPKNDFYFFMLEKKRTLERENGRSYSMAEMANYCGEQWTDIPKEQRIKYDLNFLSCDEFYFVPNLLKSAVGY